MNAKKLPPLLAARERIVITAIEYRKAILERDRAVGDNIALYESVSRRELNLGQDGRSAKVDKLCEAADRREMVHLKSVQDFFALCAELGIEPH